jgi:hypothetical protein
VGDSGTFRSLSFIPLPAGKPTRADSIRLAWIIVNQLIISSAAEEANRGHSAPPSNSQLERFLVTLRRSVVTVSKYLNE